MQDWPPTATYAIETHGVAECYGNVTAQAQHHDPSLLILDGPAAALVAQAPIKQLRGAKRSRSFTVTFRGDEEAARTALQAEPWLVGIATVSPNGADTCRVDATDAQAAEARLLPTLFANGATGVGHVGATKQNLEDVFLSLVDGCDR